MEKGNFQYRKRKNKKNQQIMFNAQVKTIQKYMIHYQVNSVGKSSSNAIASNI